MRTCEEMLGGLTRRNGFHCKLLRVWNSAMSYQQQRVYVRFVVRCAQECERWADECAGQGRAAATRRAVWLCRECAETCRTAAEELSCGTMFVYEICRRCIETCRACAAECGRLETASAQRCAEACRQCAEELQQLTAAALEGCLTGMEC